MHHRRNFVYNIEVNCMYINKTNKKNTIMKIRFTFDYFSYRFDQFQVHLKNVFGFV